MSFHVQNISHDDDEEIYAYETEDYNIVEQAIYKILLILLYAYWIYFFVTLTKKIKYRSQYMTGL